MEGRAIVAVVAFSHVQSLLGNSLSVIVSKTDIKLARCAIIL